LEEIKEETFEEEIKEEIKEEPSRSPRGYGGIFKGLEDSALDNQLIVPPVERSQVSSIDISDCSGYIIRPSGSPQLQG